MAGPVRIIVASKAGRLLVLCAALLAVGAAPVLAADYSYWYAYPQQKVYRTTLPPTLAGRASRPTTTTVQLEAARAEYEARQIVIRPFGAGVTDVWIAPSDLVKVDGNGTTSTIPASDISVFKIHYVNIATPSYGYRTRGYQPDALLPMTLANGQRLGWRPNGASAYPAWRGVNKDATQPFYVRFRVPDGAAAGNYYGTLKVTARGQDGSAVPDVVVPIRLTVHPFSVARRTLRTSFGMSLRWARYANSASHAWLSRLSAPPADSGRVAERTTFYGDQITGWYRFFSEYRLSPQTIQPAWQGGSDWAPPMDDGSMSARDDYLNDYLGAGAATTFAGKRFGFNSVKMPDAEAKPSYIVDPFSSLTAYRAASKYYSTMRSELGSYLWKAYVYPVDEPGRSKRSFVERYAELVHKAAPGAKFLVTLHPPYFDYKPLRNVDIYVNKLHFYYRDYWRWVAPMRRAGKQVWMYSHGGLYQAQVPMYLIDKPLTESRVQGWFAYHGRAEGLLYYNVDRWGMPEKNSSQYRDPYKDPLSVVIYESGKRLVSNGEGSLVYPGYYPDLGLTVQGAPPVGSLRMEALRDGLEDYEYLKLLEAKSGTSATGSFVAKIIGKPKTVISAERPTFPAYSKSVTSYESVRRYIARQIAR